MVSRTKKYKYIYKITMKNKHIVMLKIEIKHYRQGMVIGKEINNNEEKNVL
jgi:hypothetical protein